MKILVLPLLKNTKQLLESEILQIAEKCDGIILGTCSHNDYPPTNEGGLNPSGLLENILSFMPMCDLLKIDWENLLDFRWE